MLNKIKEILGITDTSKDSILQILIDNASDEVKNYCHITDLSDDLNNIIIEMVIYKFSALGSEHLESENYSGVSFKYTTDYPDSITRQLKANRRLLTW